MPLAVVALAIVVLDVIVVADRRDDAGGVPYGSVRPGDCIERPASSVTSVQPVPCGQPHDLEVVIVTDDPAPPGAPYPGTARLIEQGAAACVPSIRAATGSRDADQLKQVEMVPEQRSWERGNRRIVCTLGRKDGRPL